MRYLLDSDMIVAAVSGRLPVAVRLSALKPGDVAVSIIGGMEAEMGLRADARAQAKYGKLLREFLSSVRVIEFGAAEAQQAQTLGHYLRQSGERIDGYGLLVAATALAHRLVLVTGEPAAYAAVPGLDVENWLRATARA